MKQIAYSRDALKTLTRMPANTVRLIRSKIEQYSADPASLANNIKALKGMDNHFRLRVGDWRVIFNETGEISPSSRSRRAAALMIEGGNDGRTDHHYPEWRAPCGAARG